MTLLRLALRILKFPVLRLRCLRHCPTPLALRYAECTSIWWTSSRRLRARRRLLRLLALSFEEFIATPSSPHQPIFLAWFERVRSTLCETDSCIASLLASSRPESSLLPPHNTQYSVGGEASLGSAAPVNPSLLAMFERPLRPSLHLGLTVREAALLEASSWALSESLSHAMWLLSGLLGFLRLQGFHRTLRFSTRWSRPCPSV